VHVPLLLSAATKPDWMRWEVIPAGSQDPARKSHHSRTAARGPPAPRWATRPSCSWSACPLNVVQTKPATKEQVAKKHTAAELSWESGWL